MEKKINMASRPFATLTVEANAVYKISFSHGTMCDVLNLTSGNIYMNYGDDFTPVDGIGEYITIKANTCYNDMPLAVGHTINFLYVKADAAGEIVIVKVR